MNSEIQDLIKIRLHNLRVVREHAIDSKNHTEARALGHMLATSCEQRRVAGAIERLERAILKAQATGDREHAAKFRTQLGAAREALAGSLGMPVRTLQE